ncbi:hypothetical protein ACE6H2_007955 [Prunus campanulata]
MIYRKWSLLTGPVAILGGIVGTVVVGHYLLIENVIFPFIHFVVRLIYFQIQQFDYFFV